MSCACLLFWLNYALYPPFFFSLCIINVLIYSALLEWMCRTAFPVFWIIKCLISFFRWKKESWWDCKRKVLYYSNSYLKKTGIRKFLTIKRPFGWLEAGKAWKAVTANYRPVWSLKMIRGIIPCLISFLSREEAPTG